MSELMILEEICVGHIIKSREECYECQADDYNRGCVGYKPVLFWSCDVSEDVLELEEGKR